MPDLYLRFKTAAEQNSPYLRKSRRHSTTRKENAQHQIHSINRSDRPLALSRCMQWFVYLTAHDTGKRYARQVFEAVEAQSGTRWFDWPAELSDNPSGPEWNNATQTEVRTTKPELVLRRHPHRKEFLHYSARSIELLGRQGEMTHLQRFLDSSEMFSWIQISGPAGIGKSRIALETMISAERHGWITGLLQGDEMQAFLDKWESWEPERPYLMVSDYVVGNEHLLGPTLRLLSKLKQRFRAKVRVILLERQRWDRPSSRADTMRKPVALLPGNRAAWFETMLGDDHDADETIYVDAHFGDAPLDLSALGDPQLLRIVEETTAALDSKSAVRSKSEIIDFLRSIDSDGRPLYAYLLGSSLAAGSFRKEWRRDDLLDDVISRERKRRWRAKNNSDPPELSEGSTRMLLSAVATAIRRICLNVDLTPFGLQSLSLQTIRDINVITDNATSENARVSNGGLHGLEPDLLGEWLVLSIVEDGGRHNDIANLCWHLNAREFSNFLERASQNFPTNRSLHRLLDNKPTTSEAIGAYANVAPQICMEILISGMPPPSTILEVLDHCCRQGDRRSCAVLNNIYSYGLSGEPNYEAAKLYEKLAAKFGHTDALLAQGKTFASKGNDPDNVKLAVEAFTSGAKLGDLACYYALGELFFRRPAERGENLKDPSEYVAWGPKIGRDNDANIFHCVARNLQSATYATQSLDNFDGLWPCEPIIPVKWRHPSEQEFLDAISTLMSFSAFHVESNIDLRAARVSDVDFYQNAQLFEFLVELEGKKYVVTCLKSGQNAVLLDGTANPIDYFNSIHKPLINSEENLLSYLRLYCASLCGSGGICKIISIEDQSWSEIMPFNSLEPDLEVSEPTVTEFSSTVAKVTADLKYGNAIFPAQISVELGNENFGKARIGYRAPKCVTKEATGEVFRGLLRETSESSLSTTWRYGPASVEEVPTEQGSEFNHCDFLMGQEDSIVVVVPHRFYGDSIDIFFNTNVICFVESGSLVAKVRYHNAEVCKRLSKLEQVGIVEFPVNDPFPDMITNVATVHVDLGVQEFLEIGGAELREMLFHLQDQIN